MGGVAYHAVAKVFPVGAKDGDLRGCAGTIWPTGEVTPSTRPRVESAQLAPVNAHGSRRKMLRWRRTNSEPDCVVPLSLK